MLKDAARGLFGGLQRVGQGVSGLLYPGGSNAQAMSALGAGLLGGQDFGSAWQMGQQAQMLDYENKRREQEEAQRRQILEMKLREIEEAKARQAQSERGQARTLARMSDQFPTGSAARSVLGGLPPERMNELLAGQIFGDKGETQQAAMLQEYNLYAQQMQQTGRQPLDMLSYVRTRNQSAQAAPSGYMWAAPGQMAAIPGGPADNPAQISPAQKAIDSKFAPDYVQFVSGGAADSAKSIAELREAIGNLESGSKNITGPVLGSVPSALRSVFNPTSVDTQEAVEQTVQRSLRAILGAQFTEKEGERLIARAYNPRLDEKVNAKRVGRLLTQLERAYEGKKAAADYYEKNGTLAGFQGKYDFTISDFAPDGASGKPLPNMPSPGPNKGRRIRDKETGTVYVSDGLRWVPEG